MSFLRVFIVPCVLGVVVLWCNPGWGQSSPVAVGHASASDQKFLLDVAQSGRHEVQMARLGIEHSGNNDLKIYAQHVIDDHTLSNAEVEALSRLKGVTLPNPKETDIATGKLAQVTGIEFDQEFVREMIDGHLKDLAEFEAEAQSTTADPDIKGFANGMLPKLHAHLDQAKALKL